MTRRRRNGFDLVAMLCDQWDDIGGNKWKRGARLARYWADRQRKHQPEQMTVSERAALVDYHAWKLRRETDDAYARGYADCERDVVAMLRSRAEDRRACGQSQEGVRLDMAANAIMVGEHRKERDDE